MVLPYDGIVSTSGIPVSTLTSGVYILDTMDGLSQWWHWLLRDHLTDPSAADAGKGR